jgi:mRNA-degrading endonuclease RelE of RelBE toxin-antitoxin system
MKYFLKPSKFFLEQLDALSDEAARLIENKLKLVKINPFRNKKIQGYKLFLFRIRFEDNRKEKRVIYLVDKPFVKILCILNRDKEYRDLSKYLKKLGYL